MEVLNFIKCELSLDFKRLLSYKVTFISDIVIYCMTIVAAFVFGLDDAFAYSFGLDDFSAKMMVLIGFIFWQISTTALGWNSAIIQNELTTGVFEIKMQSKFPVSLMLFIEMMSSVIIEFISMTIIFIIYLLIINANVVQALYVPLSYIVALPAIIGMFGIGLIIGGVSLREKRSGNLVFILQSVLVFISDFTGVRSRIFNIIPFNPGIKIIRSLYLSKPVQGSTISDYFIINIIWLFLGLIIFKAFLAKERKNGSFDTY